MCVGASAEGGLGTEWTDPSTGTVSSPICMLQRSPHRDCKVDISEAKRGGIDVPKACEGQCVVTAGTQLRNEVGEDAEGLTKPCDIVGRVTNGLVCTNLRFVELRRRGKQTRR